MLKAVIFDFDGVVSDSEPMHYKSFGGAAAEYGFDLTEELYYKDYVGYCDRECFENLIKNFPDELKDADVERLLEIKTELFHDIAIKEANVFDGVKDFLRILKDNNIHIGICSGATLRDIKIMLYGTGIDDVFDIIVSDDDVSKGKPDPQGYKLALERLNEKNGANIEADQCVVIEDSHWGLEAGIDAGMHTVAVTNTYHKDDLSMAEMIVDNLGDITMENLMDLCE
jgi:beta-phosphoglucomutase